MCFMTSCCRKEPWAHLLWKWYLPTFNCPAKALGLAQYDWSMTGETLQRWIIRTVFYKGGAKTEVFIFQFMALGIGEGCIGNIGLAARAVVVKINPVYFYCLLRVPKSSIQALCNFAATVTKTYIWCPAEGCRWVWPSGSGCIVYRTNDRLLLRCLDSVFMVMHDQFSCSLWTACLTEIFLCCIYDQLK